LNIVIPSALAELPLWLRIAIVPLFVGAIVLVAELCHRWRWLPSEQTRKIVHIGTGNVIAIAWLLKLPAWVGITSSVLAAVVTIISYWWPILPGVNSVGRHSLGTFFYSVSMGLLIAIFWPWKHPEYAVIGILVMAWGDGMAAVIGQRYGQHRYQIWGNGKSWEGTIALSIISYIVVTTILFAAQGNLPITWLVGIPVAVAAIGLESVSQWGIDNLTLPIGSAFLAFWLNTVLPGN
jgi:phytol kinase